MKIFYNRYTELGCFTVRGTIGVSEWKMLRLGFDSLFKEMEEMLVLNFPYAEIPADVASAIAEYKKIIPNLTKHKVYVISKDRTIGDFPKLDLLLSRFSGSKFRQIGDKIIMHDQIYMLEQEILGIEAQIKALGFDDSSSRKEIQKNNMAKAKKKSLDGCLKWQRLRLGNFQKIPSDIEELEIKIKNSLEELSKAVGKPIDL